MKKSSGNVEFRIVDSKVYVLASVVNENDRPKFIQGFINKPEVQEILSEFAMIPETEEIE